MAEQGRRPVSKELSLNSGKRKNEEQLWQDFFSDPSQWWDHRTDKGNGKFPDFKHSRTQVGLWLDSKLKPQWVNAELAVLAPGTLKSSVFSWNTRLAKYVKAGEYGNAIDLCRKLEYEGICPNKFTFVPVLNACAGLLALEEGKRIHALTRNIGFQSDVSVGNALIDMYAKCGSIENAWAVFKEIPIRNVVTWSTIILGYVKCGDGQKALTLFRDMVQDGVEPNSVTFMAVLNACASLAALEEGRCVHHQIIGSGFEFDVSVGSCLVDMYAKCGSIEDARRVFDRMPTHNTVSWNAMLGGYAMHGDAQGALNHFERMCQTGVKMSGFTFTILLSACSHAGLLTEGQYYFENMSSVYNIPVTLSHYSCIVDLLGRAGHLHEAEDLVNTMSVEVDAAVWRSLLGACRVHGNVYMAQRVAQQVVGLDPGNAGSYVLLSNACAASGKLNGSVNEEETPGKLCL